MSIETIKKGIKYELFVSGMHCSACEIVIEKKLSSSGLIKNVNAVMAEKKIYFECLSDIEEDELIAGINGLIRKDGYTVSRHRAIDRKKYRDIIIGFFTAAILITGFIFLQKSGFVNLLQVQDLSLGVIFIIGIIASLSSCMAVVGGLVLSISSNYARSKEKVRPLLFFHFSRLAGFFVLGGVLGLAGSVFTISPVFYFIISIILFAVMLVLGVNLLDLFPFLAKFQLRLPKSFTEKIIKNDNLKNKLAPLILGAATFFLPCGFTQSMQISSMVTGNFWDGALIMLVFAAGTLPVLAAFSFTSVSFAKKPYGTVFYKTAGFIIIFFAVFNFINALVSMGIISPVF